MAKNKNKNKNKNKKNNDVLKVEDTELETKNSEQIEEHDVLEDIQDFKEEETHEEQEDEKEEKNVAEDEEEEEEEEEEKIGAKFVIADSEDEEEDEDECEPKQYNQDNVNDRLDEKIENTDNNFEIGSFELIKEEEEKNKKLGNPYDELDDKLDDKLDDSIAEPIEASTIEGKKSEAERIDLSNEQPEISKTPTQYSIFTTQDEDNLSQNELTRLTEPEISPLYKYVEVHSLSKKISELTSNFVFGLAVVDFDHIKGPELSYWLDDEVLKSSPEEFEKVVNEKIQSYSKIWPYFAFQALPDGVHMYDETFTQFTLCFNELRKTSVDLDFERVDIISNESNEGLEEEAKGIENGNGNENETKQEKGKIDDFDNITLGESIQENKRPVIVMEDPNQGIVTLFGCACIRQIESDKVKNLHKNFKRSIIQKSIVLITRLPLPIQLREKLSIVTQSWFEQYDFEDTEILKALYFDLSTTYNKNGYLIEDDELYEINNKDKDYKEKEFKIINESDFYMGLNFQQMIKTMRRNLLIIFKIVILGNSKVLFFSKDLNLLSNIQYCIVGLISNLLLNLQSCGYPLIDKYFYQTKEKSKSLKSSDRSSILKFLGLPLNVFGLRSFFQPYLTLQQLSYINNLNTESFIVGSSNDIILEHKKEWFDVIVYLDEQENNLFGNYSYGSKIEILNKNLKDTIGLTWEDKKFIDYIINNVELHYSKMDKDDDTTTAINNSKTINSNFAIDNGNYKGGDDFIRSQFEDYLIGFLSCIKYDNFLKKEKEKDKEDINIQKQLNLDLFENEISKFSNKYVEMFKQTRVYNEWNTITEDELFNFFEPKHVGKDIDKEESNSKANNGDIFHNWISRWKEGEKQTDKQDRHVDNSNNNNKDKDKENDSVEEDKVEADKAEEKNDDVTVKETMKDTVNQIGLFFKRIGHADNVKDSTDVIVDGHTTNQKKDEPIEEGVSLERVALLPETKAIDKLRGLFSWKAK
jgi:hypothetical protein